MGQTHQPPLGFDLGQSPEHKAAETAVMLEIAKDGFDFGVAAAAEQFALLGMQVAAGLLAKLEQAETDAHMAVAFGAGASGFERAVITRSRCLVPVFPVCVLPAP